MSSIGGQIYISFMRGESQAVFAGPSTDHLGMVKIVADKTVSKVQIMVPDWLITTHVT